MHFRHCKYENIQYSGYLSPERTLYGGHHRPLGNHPQDGYLLSFCFNKTKKSGILPPVELNGRTLIEAIV